MTTLRPRVRTAGFTLIELLVVLAIVSTLLLLVAPRYLHQLDASKDTVLRENLRTTRDVLDKFYGDMGRYPESLEELVDKRYLRAIPVDPVTESNATWLIVPVPAGYKGAVYDIKSGAQGQTGDGKNYADW